MVMSLEERRRDAQEREAAVRRAKVERVNREEADWRLYCADPEGARQRAAPERVQREVEIHREQQPDWSAFWGMIDQRIAAAMDAQSIFSEVQRDVLVTMVNDARDDTREQVSKAVDDLRAAVDARFEALECRARAPGALPPVKAWRQRMVVYEGELASFVGRLYQAKFDTGSEPGDAEAWTLVARAGKDTVQVTPRGEWSATASYELLSLVTYQGGSYLATRNDPGEPGDGKGGWQMIASRGVKGILARADRAAIAASEA